MASLAKNRVAFALIIAVLLVLVGAAAIFWARGFKPDLKHRSIDRTGLIVASSVPTGARVYLDDRLTSATDTNIAFLDPKKYKVKIQKDGYTTWEKEVEVKADLAVEIKALLFPQAPEIKPQTTTGANSPALSPDGQKIAYGVSGERGGAYLLLMETRPFPFRQDVRLLAKNSAVFDFARASFVWNPNSKELIAHFEAQDGRSGANILIDSDRTEQELRDITGSLTSTLNSYQQDIITRAQTLAITAPDEVKGATAEAEAATGSQSTVNSSQKALKPSPIPTANHELSTVNQLNYFPTGMIFSPDEEKILYKNREGKYKIWDLKTKKEFTLPDFADFVNISWYPDSNHLVVAQKNLISIMEADGANKVTIYSGKFENGFVFAHPSGTKLIILTALTQPEGTPPNLYSINLR